MREILASVARPFRYVGGEAGSVTRDWQTADVRVCLAFPDAYEIGMSHQGLAILYDIINSEAGMLAERAFAPWEDMEGELRARSEPLFSLESHRSLADFDIVGMSLAYELTYTNVLNMLSLGGIPLRAESRREGDPVVIAGGPCAFNPMPIAPFFDAIVIGDGEEAIVEIARLVREGRRAGKSRGDIVDSLSRIRGVCVRGSDGPVGQARVADLDSTKFPSRPICAHSATQERVAVEVARGCARGCRFCQAGFIYRPVRQREGETAVSLAIEGVCTSGREDFSFLSLSIGDWLPLESALVGVHGGCGRMEVNAALPSLRAEALTEEVTGALGRARHGSFTLAPEAATERMRRAINKGNTDDDLYASVERVFAGGWQAIKLYFMLGLPGETCEEVEGIVRVANRCLDIGRRYHRRPSVTVSTSTFVPKPHTPFQWDGQISIERTVELQRVLKRNLRRPGLSYRWHGAEMSYLEGALSRGGGEMARVIERAFERGARFDGWDERFDFGIWRAAFADAGVDPDSYLAERRPGDLMPWDHLGAGPSREFLIGERERAAMLAATPDCTDGECSGCGMCDFKDLKNRIAQATRERQAAQATPDVSTQNSQLTAHRYRIQFSRTGRAAFLGQVETLDAVRRALRASGLPLVYSGGFHPRAKISAGPALALGVESRCEHVDVELSSEGVIEGAMGAINRALPQGMRAERAWSIGPKAASIDEATAQVRYEVGCETSENRASEAASRFGGAASLIYTRVRRERSSEVDLKDYVAELAETERGVLGITVRNLKPALKISEILAAIFGISEDDARKLPVRKVGVEWR